MLTPHQQAQYQAEGCLVLPGFKTAAEVAALRHRALALIDAFDAGRHRAVFATDDQARKTSTATFLASAEGIECFFEEGAFDADGRLVRDKAGAINKIGHALHDLDPVAAAFSHGPALAAVAAGVGLAAPQVWQSMVICKPPAIGGEVHWHQDASFLHTTPESVVGFWFALEDATRDNGCLWVQPGGHRGPLRERFGRVPSPTTAGGGVALALQTLDATPWPTLDQAVPLEVPAGTLVVFDGLLPHCSAPNRSDRSRMAYTLHATDGRAAYSPLNWLQRPTLPLRGFD